MNLRPMQVGDLDAVATLERTTTILRQQEKAPVAETV